MPKKKLESKNNDYNVNTNQLDESEYEDIEITSENDTDADDYNDDDIISDVDNNNTDNEECIYDNVNNPRGLRKKHKNNKSVDDNNEYDEENDDEYMDKDIDNDDNIENTIKNDVYISDADKCSRNILTKYEVVRLLGERTTQLSYGAKPMINGVNGMAPRIVAQLELESKMIPIKVVRTLPNGKKEIWTLDELILKDIYNVYGFTGGTVDKESVLRRANKGNMSHHLY